VVKRYKIVNFSDKKTSEVGIKNIRSY